MHDPGFEGEAGKGRGEDPVCGAKAQRPSSGSAFEDHTRLQDPIKACWEGEVGATPLSETGAGGGIQTTALQILQASLPSS